MRTRNQTGKLARAADSRFDNSNRPITALPARLGYNLAAKGLRQWPWTAFWRQYEAPIVQNWIEDARSGVSIDIGCGPGTYTAKLAARSELSIAIDISEAMLAETQQTAPAGNVRLIQADVVRLPIRAKSVDALICTRVLSHVRRIDDAISEIGRVAQAGARLLLTDVHAEHPYSVTRIRGAGVNVSVETYKHSLNDVIEALAAAGYQEIDAREIGFADLIPQPDREAFAKLFENADRKVFYVVTGRMVK